MEKSYDYNEQNFKIKINFYGKEIDLSINSDYNSFIQNIYNILQISPKQLNTFEISYNDEDGDCIALATEEDYRIFFSQVQQNVVNKLIIEKKDIPINKSNPNLNNNLNKEDKNEQQNENNDYINDDINNINNENNYMNNNYYYEWNYHENNNNNNLISNKEPIKEDIPIENVVFYYKCSNCELYPIVCVIYYCDKCSLYLCEQCEKNKNNHEHPLLKIESKAQLDEIKKKENEKIEKMNKEKERKEMNKNNQYSIPNNNNYNQNYSYNYWNRYPFYYYHRNRSPNYNYNNDSYYNYDNYNHCNDYNNPTYSQNNYPYNNSCYPHRPHFFSGCPPM